MVPEDKVKLSSDKDKIVISKHRLINTGLLIVIFNPLPAGLIYSFILWREPSTRKDGKLMIIFSLIWGAVSLALAQRYLGY